MGYKDKTKNIKMERKYYYLNIVDRNLHKLLSFSRLIEQISPKLLTGINYFHLNDETHMLGLVFIYERAWKQAIIWVKAKEFKIWNVRPEKYQELVNLSKVFVLGNFSHRMIAR